MWYSNSSSSLDYSKPIRAKSDTSIFLLMPVRVSGMAVHYEWFDVGMGRWNSSARWKTAEEAVNCYLSMSYTIENVKVILE